MGHVPVLLNESIEGLDIRAGDVVIDATLGAGGHSSEIAKRFGQEVRQIGFDLDKNALALAEEAVREAGGKLLPINANFRHMEEECKKRGIESADKILFDLGVSSMEFGQSGRGFSFKYDEPLLMTLSDDPEHAEVTARDIVNSTREDELADIIFKYGDERFSRRIAKAIVEARRRKRIETTFELAEIVKDAVPAFYRNGRLNPATRTFQALRIATNDELGALEDGLRGAWNLVSPGGRIAVITFHSLEDRIVKNFFKEKAKEEGGVLINKKPLVPVREEIITNPRSRSAKLRIIQKNNI